MRTNVSSAAPCAGGTRLAPTGAETAKGTERSGELSFMVMPAARFMLVEKDRLYAGKRGVILR